MPNVVDSGGAFGPSIYDTIVLGGVQSPGTVVLSGHDQKIVWDVQQGPFLAGAITRFKSRPPPEFTCTFYLVKDYSQGLDDFAAWPAFQTLCESTVANPRAPKALLIYHPDLAANKITTVVLANMGGPAYDGKGGAHVVVKFQVYAPPRAVEGTVQAKPQNDPNAAMKAQVQKLTKKYQTTPSG